MTDEHTEKPSWYKALLDDIRNMFSSTNEEVSTNEEAVEKQKSNFVVKQIGDVYRWFGWVTNKWEDRDKEILVDAAHREFIAWLDDNPDQAPELWTWHVPGTARKNKADWWDYANGFVVFSGVLEPEEAVPYMKGLTTKENIGMSHGFQVYDRVGRYITKYRTFEVSELPLDVAANPYTEYMIKEEMNEMFTDRKMAFLVERYGAEHAEALASDTEAREKTLTELGVNWKEVNAEYEAQVEAEFASRVADASKATAAAIVKQVIDAMNIEGLQETLKNLKQEIDLNRESLVKIAALEEKVDHLLETEDARIAKAIAPANPFDWSLSVTNSEKNIVTAEDLDDELAAEVAKAAKGVDWVSNMNPFKGMGVN